MHLDAAPLDRPPTVRGGYDPLRVALVHHRDARSVRNSSGTLYFSARAVASALGPLTDLSPGRVPLWPLRLARRVILATTGRTYDYDHDPALARICGRYFTRLVAEARPDLVFSPAGSTSLAYLETDVPVIYFTDGPWSVIQGYNPAYVKVTRRTARAAEELERRSLERAAIVLVSSEWAREAAIRHYGIDPAKVHDIGIGANLVDPPSREELPARRVDGPLRLLMVGVDWEGKGGPIAVEALHRLVDMGYEAELTVVGCEVPARYRVPGVISVPFLHKAVPEEYAYFQLLWRNAHFFILPTRAEAAGVVFCEAAAYGIPSIAAHTGGVPSIIHEGRNGFTLPLCAGGDAYAERIAELLSDPARYAELCRSSREEYDSRLSWEAWGARAARIVAATLPHLAARLPAPVDAPRARV